MTRTKLPTPPPDPYVDLGCASRVHFAEVAAVHGCVIKEGMSAPVFAIPYWAAWGSRAISVQAVVITRAGTLLPAYERPETIMSRLSFAQRQAAIYARDEPADWTSERAATYQRGYNAGRKRAEAEKEA